MFSFDREIFYLYFDHCLINIRFQAQDGKDVRRLDWLIHYKVSLQQFPANHLATKYIDNQCFFI